MEVLKHTLQGQPTLQESREEKEDVGRTRGSLESNLQYRRPFEGTEGLS